MHQMYSFRTLTLVFSLCLDSALALGPLAHLRPRDVQGCTASDTAASDWAVDKQYGTSTLIRYQTVLYQALQGHHSQADWSPNKTPALWATPLPCGITEWRAQSLYAVGSVVTYKGKTYTCIQAHESLQNWDPPSTPALWSEGQTQPNPQPASNFCKTSIRGDELLQHAQASDVDARGKVLLITADKVIAPSDNPDASFASISTFITYLVGADEVMTINRLEKADLTMHLEIHYGPIIAGATKVILDVQADQTTTGTVDGQAVAPFKFDDTNAVVKFADGTAIPKLSSPLHISSEFSSVNSKLGDVLKSCPLATDSISTSRSSSGISLFRRDGLGSPQDAGHFSFPQQSTDCYLCKGKVTALATAATVGCAVATCAETLGIGCIVCIGGGGYSTVKGIQACESSSDCCPSGCGGNLCCAGGETCLDNNGRCCSAGKQPCAKKSCCGADELCIASGKGKGTCCPTDSTVCDGKCCPNVGDVCLNGSRCCSPIDACGSVCCNNYDPTPGAVNLRLFQCADAGIGLCCWPGQVAIAGICCYPGQVPMNGTCCSPDRVNCGDGECCAGTCEKGKCKWSRTDEYCIALDYKYGACADGCSACFDGCCIVVK